MTGVLQRGSSRDELATSAPMVLPRWRTVRPSAGAVIVVLFAAHVVMKLVLFGQLAHAPLVGDETAYANSARALSNLVRDLAGLGPLDVGELQQNVVGGGWFMPGISMVLAPLFVLDPDASVTAIRAYLGVVTTLLFVVSVLSVRKVLGDLYAVALLVVPGLVPMWLLFSFTAWGDLCAGLVILILMTQLVTVFRSLREGAAPSLGQGLRLGLTAIAVVYLRSSASLLVFALGFATAAAALLMLRDRARRQSLVSIVGAGAVFMALLLPWSAFASQTLGARVVTTTSVPTVLANTFGDRDEICFGPCDPESTIWFNPLRYSREVARVTGLSEIEIADQMSAYARRDVTASSYARDVLANVENYVSEPARFATYLRAPGEQGGLVNTLVVAITNLMFFTALAAAVAMLLAVVRASYDTQVTSLLLKLGLGALLTQPFVHIAGARYWTSAAPLFALAMGLMAHLIWARTSPQTVAMTTWLQHHPADADETSTDASGASQARVRSVLSGIQTAFVAAVLLVATGVLLLAR